MNMAISSKFANDGKVQETSKKVDRMLKDIISSFNGLVSSSPWMDERTKLLAKRKASAIKSFIGYPEYLLHPDQLDSQYQSVDILKGQFLWSLINIKAAEVKNILRRIGDTKYETNDNKSWMSDPLDVNAFYGRSQNAIAVPAGILQNPFYNLGLESLNYGAIGSILGHELTHAFDNEGKNYDEKGEKHSWWSKSMMKEYDIRAKCFVRQYNNYSIDKNFKYKINGTQTLGENIADNGGVREALQAYKLFEERNGVEPKLPGLESFSHEQLFFLAYANVWCEKTSLDNDVSSLQDVHTPNRFRVKGALSNSQAFSKAWFCPSGTPMNPRSKCTLW